MSRSFVLSLACLVGASAAAAESPWVACEQAMPWVHAVDVPDSEYEMVELAMTAGFSDWSRQWIAAALDAAPPFDEHLARARDEDKLVLWYVPAVDGQHVILPHLLDRYMTTGPLSDPEVVEVVRRHFVPVKLPAGGELGERFGVVAPDVMQPALVVLTPSGRELARLERIATFQPDWLLDWLSRVVAEHGTAVPLERAAAQRLLATAGGEARRDLARAWLDEGRADRAREVLTAGDPAFDVTRVEQAGDALLLARVALRERDADGARRALARAAACADAAPHAATRELLVGRLQQGLGDLAQARARYELAGELAAEADGADTDLLAESLWRAGACAWMLRDEHAARARWRRVLAEQPHTVWAGKAAASVGFGSDGLPGESALVRGMERLSWLDPAAYAPARDSQWRRTPDDARALVASGVAFLLEQQRSDGSWLGPRWGGVDLSAATDEEREQAAADTAGTFHNIRSAISALACRALRKWREVDPEAIDAALARGDAYLLRDDLVRRGDLTAWVYADAYRLLHYLDRRHDLDGDARDDVEAAMEGWVAALVAQQEELDGPFRHYAAYTSTFVTANVTWCLAEARDAGVAVPVEVFARSADVLEGARGDNGLFGYLVEYPQVGRSRLGGGNRQALCEWVLQRCGRADDEAVLRGIAIFLESFRDSAEVARKGNFHVPALDNTAGYYVFHNLLPTCLAARALGELGVIAREELLAMLCELPEVDGTFIDSGFSYGKSYSTAAALLAFEALLDPD